MVKVRSLANQAGEHHGWMIHCPACDIAHVFDTRWTFNGDKEKPTFRASMLVNEAFWPDGGRALHRCHSFVTDGKIQFLDDCTHVMKGQTVDLPDVNDGAAKV